MAEQHNYEARSELASRAEGQAAEWLDRAAVERQMRAADELMDAIRNGESFADGLLAAAYAMGWDVSSNGADR